MLIWPWQDVLPDELHFEAANLLSTRRIWLPDADSVYFQPAKVVTRGELAGLLARLHHATPKAEDWPAVGEARFTDVPADSPQRAGIEAMIAWGDFGKQQPTFTPDLPTTWGTLHRWLTALDLPANAGLAAGDRKDLPLTRAECVQHLWRVLQLTGEIEKQL